MMARRSPYGPLALEHRRAVVYFETAPRGAFEDREGARVTLDQRSETFVPHLLAITAGTTVDFPNHDRTYHNVFLMRFGSDGRCAEFTELFMLEKVTE